MAHRPTGSGANEVNTRSLATHSMRLSEWIHLGFLSFFLAVAWVRPLAWRRRAAITAMATGGILLVLAVQTLAARFPSSGVVVLRDVLSGPIMLLVYWQAGRFGGNPNEKF